MSEDLVRQQPVYAMVLMELEDETAIHADYERHVKTMSELVACYQAWGPNVCVMGNVPAKDAVLALELAVRLFEAIKRGSE